MLLVVLKNFSGKNLIQGDVNFHHPHFPYQILFVSKFLPVLNFGYYKVHEYKLVFILNFSGFPSISLSLNSPHQDKPTPLEFDSLPSNETTPSVITGFSVQHSNARKSIDEVQGSPPLSLPSWSSRGGQGRGESVAWP